MGHILLPKFPEYKNGAKLLWKRMSYEHGMCVSVLRVHSTNGSVLIFGCNNNRTFTSPYFVWEQTPIEAYLKFMSSDQFDTSKFSLENYFVSCGLWHYPLHSYVAYGTHFNTELHPCIIQFIITYSKSVRRNSISISFVHTNPPKGVLVYVRRALTPTTHNGWKLFVCRYMTINFQ